MGVFQDMVITQQGLNLLKIAQEGTELHFTRIAVGDGNLSGQDPVELTQLINQIMSLNIAGIAVGGSGEATLNTVLSNINLATGFYWRELGIFAQDPTLGEILYCYNNSAGHEIFVPSASTSLFSAPLSIEVFVSNAVNVTAQIDPSLIYVPLTGASMVGPLILSGDPTEALGAATKQYVDNHLPPDATTTQAGIVEISAASSGVPVAVSTTDPAYTAVNEGTYVIAGEGLTSTSQTNSETLAVDFSTSTPTAETIGDPGAIGSSSNVARADHVHPMPTTYTPSPHESTHVTGGSDPIPVATEAMDGLFSSTDKTKLDGITTGATNTPLSNSIPASETEGAAGSPGTGINAAREDHVHPMPATYTPSPHELTHITGGSDPIPVATETTDGLFSHTDKTKLDGIATGATRVTQASDIGAIPASEIGQPNGVASLDDTGKVPTAQIPAMDYIPTSAEGAANGVATLDTNKNVPLSQLGNVPLPSLVTETANGLMSATDKTKLDGLAPGATNTPLSNSSPNMDGTASAGTSSSAARGDHVHPTDTSRAPLASPALTGTPTAPTAVAGTNSTQLATTAFVATAIANALSSGTKNLQKQIFTSPGTFSAPLTGIYKVTVIGGGGGGHDASGGYTVWGGAAGGTAIKWVSLSLGVQVSVTIGAGGGIGSAGGTTSFGSYVSATGGQAGAISNSPPASGYGSGGDINITPITSAIANDSINVGSMSCWGGYGTGGFSGQSNYIVQATPGQPGICVVEWVA